MRGLTFYSPTHGRSVSERMAFGRMSKLPNVKRKHARTLTVISLRHFAQEMHEAKKARMVLKILKVSGWHAQMRVLVSDHKIAFLALSQRQPSAATSLNTCLKKPYSQGGLRSGSAYVIRKIGLSSLNSRLILWSYYDLLRTGTAPQNRDRTLSVRHLQGTNWRVTT